MKNIQKYFFVKSIFIDNNSLFDQIIIFNDYTDLIFAEKNNAIADLARKISHEIKNPLTPIKLAAERLKKYFFSLNEKDKLSASEYDNVTAQNTNETDKEITVSDMYGASASIKVGKTF